MNGAIFIRTCNGLTSAGKKNYFMFSDHPDGATMEPALRATSCVNWKRANQSWKILCPLMAVVLMHNRDLSHIKHFSFTTIKFKNIDARSLFVQGNIC